MGARSWIEPGKDSLTAGGQIHQQFTAQVLDNINSSVECRSVLGVRRDKSLIFEAFGSQTKGEVFPRCRTRPLHIKWRHRNFSDVIKHDPGGITFTDNLRSREEIHRRRANETCHKEVRRIIVEFLRWSQLLDESAIEHSNAATHRHCFSLVVRDINYRCLNALVQFGYICPCLHTQFGIQVRERLIHKEDLRFSNDSTTKGDTLPLTAGEFFRFTLQEWCEIEDFAGFINPLLDLIFGKVA